MTLINGQITLKENAPINITDDDVTPIKDSGEWVRTWYLTPYISKLVKPYIPFYRFQKNGTPYAYFTLLAT